MSKAPENKRITHDFYVVADGYEIKIKCDR